MDNKKLHIIAFDVPFPPNYGGIADVFYKLKSLHAAGVKIIYHCFYYKGHNPPTQELKKYCEQLHFYERKKSLLDLVFSKLPYVVVSRKDPTLLIKVLSDPAPILIDGMQCAYWMDHEDFRSQKIIFRANNIEHDYYDGLAMWERSWLKKIYLKREAKKLRNYENILKGADVILSVAKMDIPHFEKYTKTVHLPPFFNDSAESHFAESKEGEDRFVLFQGNLSVKENEHAAVHIAENIAPKSTQKFIIAGLNPSSYLKGVLAKQSNVQLIASPSHEIMDGLIRDAHINLLMTFQQTGVKLKVLHAFQSGKHIIINSKMDDAGIFGAMCEVLDDSQEIANRIDELMTIPFTNRMKKDRDANFNAIYSNEKNANKIKALI
ncbi:MAG: hypothetical protein ABJG68_11260 [Crocinitomicaceae bacterium]